MQPAKKTNIKPPIRPSLKVLNKKTTKQMFEEFYGKPYDEITEQDIGAGEEIDFGEDVGGEVEFKA
ncbi:MAG: hypothetical protein IJ685_02855 [Selenomonadaceae bacterium]|nr:hypothetical protein [Selenomonadaceae bacterium]